MSVANPIRSLALVLTSGCNLSCSYCFQNDKKQRHMDWDTMRSALDLVLDSDSEEVDLVFFGGEPLLEFGRIRRAVEYVDRRRRAGKRVTYSVVTNGTLLRGEVTDFLVDRDFEIRLSFDGVAAAQVLRGRGTFDRLDRLLVGLRADHPRFFRRRVSVGITLVPANVEHLAASIGYFLDRGVAAVSVNPTFTASTEWRIEDIAALDAQFRRVFDVCLRHYRGTGEVPLRVFRHEGIRFHRDRRNRSLCGAPTGEAPAVDVDGTVHGCVTFAGSYQRLDPGLLRDTLETLEMPRVTDPGFDPGMAAYRTSANDAEMFQNRRDKYSAYGACRDCAYMASCTVCPVSIGHIPGNSDPRRVPDFACAFNLVSLKYRDLFPSPHAPAIGPSPRPRTGVVTGTSNDPSPP